MQTWFQPVIEFEEKYGITGIGGKYIYPKGFEYVENKVASSESWLLSSLARYNIDKIRGRIGKGVTFTDYTAQKSLERLNTIFDELTENNPQLKEIELDRTSPSSVRNALRGIASGFNTDDINYYLEAQKRGGIVHVAESGDPIETQRRVLNKKVIELLGVDEGDVGWVASPVTLEKIMKQAENIAQKRNIAVAYSR